MDFTGIKINVVFIIVTLLICGCASTQKGKPVVSDIFTNEILKEVRVVHVIDARVDKSVVKDIKELGSYKGFFESTVISAINNKGYVAIESKINAKDCPSLKDITSGKQILCLAPAGTDNADITFLISIDEYIPPKSMSMEAKIGVTGILFNHKTNNILWKNSMTNESGNEVAIFGIGGYIGGLLAKSISSEDLPYRNTAYETIRVFMKSVPDCPENKCNI